MSVIFRCFSCSMFSVFSAEHGLVSLRTQSHLLKNADFILFVLGREKRKSRSKDARSKKQVKAAGNRGRSQGTVGPRQTSSCVNLRHIKLVRSVRRLQVSRIQRGEPRFCHRAQLPAAGDDSLQAPGQAELADDHRERLAGGWTRREGGRVTLTHRRRRLHAS